MKNILCITLVALFLLVSCSGAADHVASAVAAHSTPAAPSTQESSAAETSTGPRKSFGDLSFEVPKGWLSREPSSQMRLAQYAVSPAPGDTQEGECVLYHFPRGQGGTVEANLQRWYGQFQQPDGSSTAERAEVESFTAGEMAVTFVQVAGTFSASRGPMASTGEAQPGYGMTAGVIETDSGPWMLKCVGPAATIREATPGARAFLSSVQGG